MSDWSKAAEEFIGNLPSPNAPGILNRDYATAVKLATYTKEGGIANAEEAEGFWQSFQNMNSQLEQQGKHPFSPEDYKQAFDQLSPLSHTFANRPPTMREIATYGMEHPSKQRDYFQSLPDQNYPHITNGQAVQMTVAATPHSQEHMGRPPVKSEVAYLIHSKEDPSAYYQRAKDTQLSVGKNQGNAVQTGARGNQVPGGAQAPGGRQTNQ